MVQKEGRLVRPSWDCGVGESGVEIDEFGLAGEGGLEAGVEGADDLEVLGAAGFGFGTAGDPVVPAAHDVDVEGRSFVASVTSSAMRRVPGSVGAHPSSLTSRYPVEGRPPPLGAARGALLKGLRWSEVHNGSGKRDTAQSV